MMKIYRILLLLALCPLCMSVCAQKVEKGVSKELADQRKACISNVRYDLTFNIPAGQRDKVTGMAVVSFNLKKKEDVVLDFQGKLNGNVYGGKKKRKITTKNDNIIISIGCQHLRELAKQINAYNLSGKHFLLAMKGLEEPSAKILVDVMAEEITQKDVHFACLGGPGHVQDYLKKEYKNYKLKEFYSVKRLADKLNAYKVIIVDKKTQEEQELWFNLSGKPIEY